LDPASGLQRGGGELWRCDRTDCPGGPADGRYLNDSVFARMVQRHPTAEMVSRPA